MGTYFRTPEMQTGIGFICPTSGDGKDRKKGFRCPNCNKLLVIGIHPPYDSGHYCSRCKSFIHLVVKSNHDVDENKKYFLGVKVNSPRDISLRCFKCKLYLRVKMREPVPWVKKEEKEEKTEEAPAKV